MVELVVVVRCRFFLLAEKRSAEELGKNSADLLSLSFSMSDNLCFLLASFFILLCE